MFGRYTTAEAAKDLFEIAGGIAQIKADCAKWKELYQREKEMNTRLMDALQKIKGGHSDDPQMDAIRVLCPSRDSA